jgi:hypothetical protein
VIVLSPAGAHDRARRRAGHRRDSTPSHDLVGTADGNEDLMTASTTGTTSFTDHVVLPAGNEATIDYTFVDMTVEVARSTGPDSERATWKLNGTLRITSSDKNDRGSINGSGA